MINHQNPEVLWKSFSSDLRAFILSKVKNDADTDDILQELFIRIHNNIHGLKNETKIRSFIYQIARNLIIDHFRTSKPKISVDDLKTVSEQESPGKMDEAIRDMIGMMNKMSPESCEALCLTEIEGLSQKQYAEMKGISYSGAKSRVQRARSMLKDMLLQCCHYQFDKYGTVISINQRCCHCCSHSDKS